MSIETQPVHEISSVELHNRGRLSRIIGRSFVAGVLPIKVAHQMADSAKLILRKNYSNVAIDIEIVKENPAEAFGTGSGIM